MPNSQPLPHPAEALGGVSQISQCGSILPPPVLCIARRLGQWLLLARPTASIGRENGTKVTFVAGTHDTQEPQRLRLSQVFQES